MCGSIWNYFQPNLSVRVSDIINIEPIKALKLHNFNTDGLIFLKILRLSLNSKIISIEPREDILSHNMDSEKFINVFFYP
jgi:hypothetical protein